MGWRVNPLGIVQEIEIWPYEQMIYAQPRICPGEWDTQASLGFWNNGPKDKKVDNDVQVFTSERCHRQIICIKKRRRKETCQLWGLHRDKRLITAGSNSNKNVRSKKKTTKKLNTEMRRKTNVWLLQETNETDCTWEDLSMVKKRKLQERYCISFNGSTK